MSGAKDATLNELRWRFLTAKPRNPFRVATIFSGISEPRVSKQPWADIRQRFQRYAILDARLIFDFCAKPWQIKRGAISASLSIQSYVASD
jgi:hypothetical protein